MCVVVIVCVRGVCTCMCACMYMRACMRMCVYTLMYIYVCSCVLHVCVHLCTCAWCVVCVYSCTHVADILNMAHGWYTILSYIYIYIRTCLLHVDFDEDNIISRADLRRMMDCLTGEDNALTDDTKKVIIDKVNV